MKDTGKITLKRAINCYTPIISQIGEETKKSRQFFDTYGFHFEETWNLDKEIAYFTLVRLVYLRDNLQGFPAILLESRYPWDTTIRRRYDSTLTRKEEVIGMRRWKTILDKIIRGLYLDIILVYPRGKERKIIEQAWKLLAEWHDYLWN